MVIARKRFGFVASWATFTLLNACAVMNPREQWGVASINTIPSSLDVHRANYDLNFSLNYTNK